MPTVCHHAHGGNGKLPRGRAEGWLELKWGWIAVRQDLGAEQEAEPGKLHTHATTTPLLRPDRAH